MVDFFSTPLTENIWNPYLEPEDLPIGDKK